MRLFDDPPLVWQRQPLLECIRSGFHDARPDTGERIDLWSALDIRGWLAWPVLGVATALVYCLKGIPVPAPEEARSQ